MNKNSIQIYYHILLSIILTTHGCIKNEEENLEKRQENGKADSIENPNPIQPGECPDGEPFLPNGKPATWTFMVYTVADNNLESYEIGDINEMEAGYEDTDAVNVLVQLDKISRKGMWRYKIQHDTNFHKITSPLLSYTEEEPDSGDWKTLASFGEWGVKCFPAQNYVLIIEGHGNGWTDRMNPVIRENRDEAISEGETFREIAFDETNNSSIFISKLAMALNYISSSITSSSNTEQKQKLLIYGSDACLMQTIEVEWQLKDYVSYVIGSEESEPATGWPYDRILSELSMQPDFYAQNPEKLGELITTSYGAEYSGSSGEARRRTTLSTINTSHIEEAESKFKSIAPLLLELLPQIHEIVWDARDKSFDFGETYTDMGKFLTELKINIQRMVEESEGNIEENEKEKLQTLVQEINDFLSLIPNLVTAKYSGTALRGASGISIFFPYTPSTWFLDLESYSKCPFGIETKWNEFINSLIQNYPYN